MIPVIAEAAGVVVEVVGVTSPRRAGPHRAVAPGTGPRAHTLGAVSRSVTPLTVASKRVERTRSGSPLGPRRKKLPSVGLAPGGLGVRLLLALAEGIDVAPRHNAVVVDAVGVRPPKQLHVAEPGTGPRPHTLGAVSRSVTPLAVASRRVERTRSGSPLGPGRKKLRSVGLAPGGLGVRLLLALAEGTGAAPRHNAVVVGAVGVRPPKQLHVAKFVCPSRL